MDPDIERMIQIESGGRTHLKNPRSSAYGPGQFINSTWLNMIRQYRPDLAGLPQDQLLAMRSDPNLAREMTSAYAAEGAQRLQRAGFQATPGNKYLHHFAGPQGATAVLGAAPGTPVTQALSPDQVKANPFLANWTTDQLQAWANRKMGGEGGAAPAVTATGRPPAADTQLGQLMNMARAQGPAQPIPPPSPTGASPTAYAGLLSQAEKLINPGMMNFGNPAALSPLSMGLLQPQRPPPQFDAQRFAGLLAGKLG